MVWVYIYCIHCSRVSSSLYACRRVERRAYAVDCVRCELLYLAAVAAGAAGRTNDPVKSTDVVDCVPRSSLQQHRLVPRRADLIDQHRLIGCLHDPANVQQLAKRPANVFKIHVLIAGRLLDRVNALSLLPTSAPQHPAVGHDGDRGGAAASPVVNFGLSGKCRKIVLFCRNFH